MNRIPLPLIAKALRDLRVHWYPVEAEVHPDGLRPVSDRSDRRPNGSSGPALTV